MILASFTFWLAGVLVLVMSSVGTGYGILHADQGEQALEVRRRRLVDPGKTFWDNCPEADDVGTLYPIKELVLFVFSLGPFCIFLDFEAVCIFRYFRAAFSIFPARNKNGLSIQ